MIDYEKLKEIRNMGYIKHTGIRTVELREGYAKCEIIPVSYTHLDVYKRQQWGCPKR